MTEEEIQNRMTYHPPTKVGITRHQILADRIGAAMQAVVDYCPEGRELALAITKLEEAKFWASAAVARNPETR